MSERTQHRSSCQLGGLVVYARNLYLIFRERSQLRHAAAKADGM